MKHHLKAKFYGFPQAADSAYSRLRIDAIRDRSKPSGFRIEINPQRSKKHKDFIVGQVVAVARTVEKNGAAFSGNPIKLKKLVPYKHGEFYPARVLKEVLKGL